MIWTEEEKRAAKAIDHRLGPKVSRQMLSHILQKHFKKKVNVSSLDELLGAARIPAPVVAATPLTKAPNARGLREQCRLLINELKEELALSPPLEHIVKLTSGVGISPILMLSDLHFGEVIEVNGREIFNLRIAEEGFDDIINGVIGCPELAPYVVDEMVVILGGDIIEGELIFPGQAFETSGDAYSQLKKAAAIIWNGLKALAREFPVVRVYCTPGNHGRTSHLHSQMSNWDNVLYFTLQMMSSIDTESGIEISTPHQMWTDFEVRGWRVHTRHIGVTQAVTGGSAKKVMTWLLQHEADLFFYGHFHNPEMYSMGYTRIFKNGSLPPANEFAEKLGFLDSRGQWLVGVTDENNAAFIKVLLPRL